MTRASVLVVEDDVAVREFVAAVLQEQYAVTTATNGREALALLTDRHYDLVVSNMGMPELDGPGLYREVHRRASVAPPFLFITGDHEKPDYVRFFTEAGVPSLAKPFSQLVLMETVGRLVRRR